MGSDNSQVIPKSAREVPGMLDDILIILVLTKFVIERYSTIFAPVAVFLTCMLGLRARWLRRLAKPLLSPAAVCAFLIDAHSSGRPEVFVAFLTVVILSIIVYVFMSHVFRLFGFRA